MAKSCRVHLGLLLILAAFPVMAADWQMVYDSRPVQVWVDKSSITQRDGIRKAWSLWAYTQPHETDTTPPKKFMSAKELRYFNCAARTSGAGQVIKYSGLAGEGEVVQSQVVRAEFVRLDDIVPDSVGETVFKKVCAM